MKVVTCIYMYNDNQRIFGPGPYELLMYIDKNGSLKKAALEMGVSYSKALKMISKAENALGFPLTKKTIGGTHGGGSVLSEEAKQFLENYKQYKEACDEHNRQLYLQYFSKE